MISAINFCKTIFIFSLQSKKRYTVQSNRKIAKNTQKHGYYKNIRTPGGMAFQVLFLKTNIYHDDLLLFNLSYFLLGSVWVHVFFRRSPLYYIT
jgi:hypothetical protein